MTGKAIWLAIATVFLSACGGGDLGGFASNPPVPVPTPTPTPIPDPPPAPEGPIGIVSDEPFAVLGIANNFSRQSDGNFEISEPDRANITFEYRAAEDRYFITLPGFREGALSTKGYNGSYDATGWISISGTHNDLLAGETGRQDAQVFLSWPTGPLNRDSVRTYTSWGSWSDDQDIGGPVTAGSRGYFAYGIPTAPADIPTTGSATYDAQVLGMTDQAYQGSAYIDYIFGSAELRFDFGAGTLAGEMKPTICPWDCYPLGTYNFVDTVYAAGGATFSGKLSFDGNFDGKDAPSWFEGRFNGPQAAELMARWQAPYSFDRGSGTNGGSATGTMGGIWVATKK